MKGSGLSSSDFLTDPLYVEKQPKEFASLEKWEQNNWEVFHWSTRSKLEASIWFYGQIVGLGSIRHVWFTTVRFDSLLNWHLDAFFNELMSAFETLLQEVNVVHRCGLKRDKVTWEGKRGIKGCLSGKAGRMGEIIAAAYDNETFKDIRDWRNTVFHRHHIPKVSTDVGGGEVVRIKTTVELVKTPSDPAQNVKLSKLADYINLIAKLCMQVWEQLAEEK